MEILIFIGLALIAGAIWIVIAANQNAEEQKQKDRVDGIYARVILDHTAGLPVVEGEKCMLLLYKERLNITTTSGAEFDLDMSRILNIQVKTETEIHKAYVSSVGGAVGGAMLFGAIGALIGGRVKKKIDTIEHMYCIVTYKKDDSLEHLGFDCTNPTLGEVNDLISGFREIVPYRTEKIEL